MRRIAIVGHKGGIAKTTCAVNLAVGIARAGKRVLLLDTDAQANATLALGQEPQDGLSQLLTLGTEIPRVRVPIEERLDLVPASRALAGIDGWLHSRPRPSDVLRRRLAGLAGYDLVICDTPPSYGRMVQNVLMFATEAWLPVAMEYYSLQGARDVLTTLEELRDEAEHDVPVTAIIPTFHDGRHGRTEAVMESLREAFGDLVTPPLRVSTKVSEAPSHGRSIWDYDPRGRGVEDFTAILRSVLWEKEPA